MSLPAGPRPGSLVVDVDVSVEVTDHAGRRTSGRVVGSGNRLRMTVSDPAVVVSAAGRGGERSLAEGIAAAGLHAELRGPRGRVARIDPDRTSRLGSLLVGSPHVVLAPSAWTVAARSGVPMAGRLVAGSVGLGGAIVVAWWLVRRTR